MSVAPTRCVTEPCWLAGPCFLPAPVLAAGRGGECDRARTRGHQQRAPDDPPVKRRAAPRELAEYADAPQEPPQLIRVRERDAAADAHVLGRVLLEQIAHHPD